MITLEMHHMALNAIDPNDDKYTVPSPRYSMWNTYNVPKSHTAEHILEWVAKVARGSPSGKLQNLVVNCHGITKKNKDKNGKVTSKSGGQGLSLGSGFFPSNVNLWAKLQGLVENIWLVVCRTAQNKEFCSNIAIQSGAMVRAAVDPQNGNAWQCLFDVPYGQLDDFEGKVYWFGPDGTSGLSAFSED